YLPAAMLPGQRPADAVNPPAPRSRAPASGNMGTLCLDVHGIQGRAARHEQPVALAAAEADVAADFRQQDLTDARAVGGKDVHAVIAIADPASAGPNVAVHVAANSVGEAGFDLLAITPGGHFQSH